jgi:hypothetical protein
MLRIHLLKKHSENPKIKHNWFRSFKSRLYEFDCQEILNMESSTEESMQLVKNRICSFIDSIRSKAQQQDILTMQSSASKPMYNKIRTHCKTELHLNMHMNW